MGQEVVLIDPKTSNYFYEEALKTLRTNILFGGRNIQSIVLTSCFPNEGKSDVVMQLAREFGKMGKRVLLIDADIRKSALANRYQVKQSIKGLSQYLTGQAELSEICYQTNFPNMDIIFSGPTSPNPSELLADDAFGALLRQMKLCYDYILVDTPPVNGIIDAAVAAQKCDGVILVIESKLVSYRIAQKAKYQLEKTGCRILGAVLNKVDQEQDRYYSKYGYYYKK